jgi:uncharacterized protein (DUF302 family)
VPNFFSLSIFAPCNAYVQESTEDDTSVEKDLRPCAGQADSYKMLRKNALDI